METPVIKKISYYKLEDISIDRVSLSWLKAAQKFIQEQLVQEQKQLKFKPLPFPDCLDVTKTCMHCDLHNTALCIVANCLAQERQDHQAGYFIIQPAQPV